VSLQAGPPAADEGDLDLIFVSTGDTAGSQSSSQSEKCLIYFQEGVTAHEGSRLQGISL
jgi:hypothetical protein